MGEEITLTKGAIAAITEEKYEGLKPVLQVLDVRLVSGNQSSHDRYRTTLFDGAQQIQGMLATQLADTVKAGSLQKGSIVRLNEYLCNTIKGRKIIIIMALEIIGSKNDFTGVQSRAPVAVQSGAVNQSSAAAGYPQSYGGSNLNPKMEQVSNPSYGGQHPRNMSNLNPLHSKVEQSAGSYSDQHMGIGNQNQRFSNPAAVGGYRPPVSFYGPSEQQTYQQPLPSYVNRGPIAKNEAPSRIVPISSLNPYQGRWTIKARVTARSELRRYSNPRGEGKVFSFDLLDSDGGEIRVTCFNMVAEQFYDQIEVGKVYLISKGTLKPAQKSFNHLNNEYEILLETTSTIQPCLEEDNTIPKQQFNFRPISEIEGMECNSTLDLIGIVTSINPASLVIRKNGIETHKRTLKLKDMSGRSVELTLWGKLCHTDGQQLQEMCDSGLFPVLAVKAGRVNEFSGKSVSTIGSSQLFVEPDFPEAHRLTEWYMQEGKNVVALSISRDSSSMGRTDVRKTVSQIKDEGLGRSEKPDWITLKATISFIKADNFCYTACPLMMGDRQCSKKVINNGDGTWHCDRCDKSLPECDYRYLLTLQVQDHTGMAWVTAFQECGEQIFGVPAKELYLLKYEEQDEEKFGEIIRAAFFNQYMFALKVKEELYNDEQRVKNTAIKVEKVNPSLESRFLLGLIDKLSVENLDGSPGIHGTYAASGSRMPNSGYGSAESKSFGNQSTGNLGAGSVSDVYRSEPINRSGQLVNEYGGVVNRGVGTMEAIPSCNNCGSSGHDFRNCPRAGSQQLQYSGGGGGGLVNRSSGGVIDRGNVDSVCFKCQQPGHWARDCPGLNAAAPPAYGGGSLSGGGLVNRPSGNVDNVCFKCQQPGHWARDCPGLNAAPPAYGGGGSMSGRYGTNVGGF